MATLNEMIAQGAQFYTPDPTAQYNKMAQMQKYQQENELAKMKMEEYGRAQQESNALRNSVSSNFDINNPTHVNAVLRASPTAGAAFLEKYSQGIKEQALAEKSKNEAIKFNLDNSRSLLVGINDQPSYDAWRAYSVKKLPDLSTILPLQFSIDIKNNLLQTADDVSKRLTAPSVYQNAAPGTTVLKDGVPIYTADEKTKVTDLMANYQAALGQGFKGSIFDYERKLKEAGRTPAQPRLEPAPTVTSIQDPTNPSQMISINARDYRGGGLGSPGVIGLTGKTPAATAKQDAIDKGNAQLSSVIDDLRASYSTLERNAAIPSTQRGTLSNLASSAQASGIGQALGRLGGTEEQSARDTINSSRLMLLNGIKTATGMSSQQLNSNMELKSWLDAVSNPTQSIETVSKVLDNIEKFVASGGKYTAKKEGAAALAPADKQALDWANANPKDPRSLQIKQRLGK